MLIYEIILFQSIYDRIQGLVAACFRPPHKWLQKERWRPTGPQALRTIVPRSVSRMHEQLAAYAGVLAVKVKPSLYPSPTRMVYALYYCIRQHIYLG